jgi:membrane protein YdbS with pleckstrin-like domain
MAGDTPVRNAGGERVADCIAVECPFCGKRSHAPVGAVGKTARCGCGKSFVVAARTLKRCTKCGQALLAEAALCPLCGAAATAHVASEVRTSGEAHELPYARPQVRSGTPALRPELLDDGETVLLCCCVSRRFLLLTASINIGAWILLLVVTALLPDGKELLAGFAILGAVIWIPAVWLFCWIQKFTVYALTEKRVIKRRGILSETVQSLPPVKITNTTVWQGVLQRLVGCGDIAFYTAASSKVEMRWESVHDPHGIVKEVRRTLTM